MTDPLIMPTALDTWRNAEPSFRGAVICAMQEAKQARTRSMLAIIDRSCLDEDVDALCARQARLIEVEAAAIAILQEAAHG